MIQRSDITKYLAEQFNLPTDEKNLKKLNSAWWANPRKKQNGGLRLSDEGFARASAHIKSHRVAFDQPVVYTNQLIIWLDKFITCPWYVTKKEIYVFDERMAVQLVLFSGNIARFGAAKARKPKSTA